jgi:adenylate cyclase
MYLSAQRPLLPDPAGLDRAAPPCERGAMGMEHERKFLVAGEPDGGGDPVALRQAYVAIDGDRTVRVRQAGGDATLTIKDGRGISRTEVELPLDEAAFAELWAVGRDRSIDKRRTRIPLEGDLVAELDEFAGRHAGLRLVEVEFPSAEAAGRFRPPAWFGDEVTGEDWASNAWLSVHGLPPR